ncbi:hypothetical protein BGZ95_003185, partial [Linnemannia exigua]
SLSPGSPSRTRLRPLSVTIDLSPAGPSEPPAYAEQYQLQQVTLSPHETRPSSLSSTRTRQHQQHQYRGSLSFTPEPILSSVAAAGTEVGAGSQSSPSTPIPVSASINLSLSAYRRPFLEEDELPDYISLTETNLPFKLPSARSITYRVSVTQGPAEFQPQQQIGEQESLTSPLNPTLVELQGYQSSAGEAGVSSTAVQGITTSNNPGDGNGTSRDQDGRVDQDVIRQDGAWTMEYWVGDTILYLCYLMDPKMSATTELVPRSRSAYMTDSMPTWSPFTLASSVRPLPPDSDDVTPTVAATTLDGQREGAVTIDMTQVNLQHTESGTRAGASNNASENEEMERVPTGHIRGQPPTINRNRYNMTRPHYTPQQASDNWSFLSRPGISNILSSGRQAPRATPRVVPVESPLARGSTSTGTVLTDGSGTPEPGQVVSTTLPTAEISEHPAGTPAIATATSTTPTTSTTSAEEAVQENAEEQAAVPSTTAQAGSLPGVRHIRINDGYPGEESDTILAHTMTRMGVPRDRQDSQSHAYNNTLTSEFFKLPSFAFVSAEDPQTWLWWSTHHENNLQRCRQEGPNEEVMMWWRTRFDNDAMESRVRRKQIKKDQRLGRRPTENLPIKERWRRFWSLKASIPYRESMEITMRVRGLYYAWREESYNPNEQMDDIQILTSNPPRYFTLVRDDSLVMGQRVKGGPVAEVVIHGDVATGPLAPVVGGYGSGGDVLGLSPSLHAGGGSTHLTETLDAPPYVPIPSIRSDGSSITSNNGNTFMTEVSAATGGPVRSTMASTFIHAVPHDRRSGSSSMRYHLSDSATPAPTIGDERRRSIAPSESVSTSPSDLAVSEQSPSSFSTSLRKRTCTIRVLEGINSEVETFALSTGPRLPELFDLFTDQSVPGPSRAMFICTVIAFGAAFVIAVAVVALTSDLQKRF